jgi:hypothetical protein
MCETCGWEDLLRGIKEMCAAGGYEFADRPLTGIYDRVKITKHATENMKRAVLNIKKSKRPRRGAG